MLNMRVCCVRSSTSAAYSSCVSEILPRLHTYRYLSGAVKDVSSVKPGDKTCPEIVLLIRVSLRNGNKIVLKFEEYRGCNSAHMMAQEMDTST